MSSRLTVDELIDKYLDDIEYLADQDDIDSDDKIVIAILTEVIGDLRNLD